MNENQAKFIELLKEMFQLNNSDLDFGIYRVLKIKQKEINSFLEKDLIKIINSNLKDENETLKKEKLNEIERLSKSAKELGQNPDDVPKIKELKKEVENIQNTTNSVENDIYSRLFDFFSRYYKNGDFVSLRRYKNKDTYAIPYNGEEVKLYWSNFDQYYIKTSEFFNDFSFKINNKKISFKIKEVEENKDNNKETKKFIFKELKKDENELEIYFEFKKESKKQNNLNQEAIEKIFNLIDDEYKAILSQKAPTAKNTDRTILEKYLTQYTSKNRFDFFIHKNLKEFLERELEFYIKNEMLYIDDLDDKNYKNIITKIKVFKQIANKIIEFLSQLEEFQKKLWEKKKFVIETNYLITLDKIDKNCYEEILNNEKQLDEWKKLFDVEIKTIEDLEKEKFLVLDTKFFDNDFKYRLLSQFDNLDEEIDGVLINSENFQALNLLIEKYKEKIKTIYIDPPYNTENGDFIYADNFKHSSWLTMMYDRLQFAREFLRNDGVIFSSIDDREVYRLKLLFDLIYFDENFVGNIIWHKKTQPSFLSKEISNIKEYILFYKKTNKIIATFGSKTNPNKHIELLNISNKLCKRYFKKENILIQNGKFTGILKKGIYGNNPLQVELFEDVIVKDGKVEKDFNLEGKFKWSQEKINDAFLNGDIFHIKNINSLRITIERNNKTSNIKPMVDIISKKFNEEIATNTDASKEIEVLFNKKEIFSNPKPTKLLKFLIQSITYLNNNSYILDFFSGSGTTGDAVIRLNREDEGKRKYILVEMGEYFDKVLKTRIQKVIYSDEYKNGKPQNKNGISQMVKYFKLESYEDTLNNIEFKQNKLNATLKNEYMLKYFLDIETKKSLFNIDRFKTPFSYELEIATSNVNETQNIKVDLIETFNYLLGVEVKKFDYSKDKILITAKKENKDILIIWRDTQKELKLDINLNEFDEVYINGDNEIGAKLIESEFKDLMFKGIK